LETTIPGKRETNGYNSERDDHHVFNIRSSTVVLKKEGGQLCTAVGTSRGMVALKEVTHLWDSTIKPTWRKKRVETRWEGARVGMKPENSIAEKK